MRIVWIMSLMALSAAGCQSEPQYPTAQDRQQRLREAREHERQRLEGWDKVEARKPTAILHEVLELPGRLIENLSGDTPLAAARKMLDTTNADARREGIYYLVDRDLGRTHPPYLQFYQHAALNDSD